MKYYVISRYYNSGKVEAEFLLESEYDGQKSTETKQYTQYVDTFESYEEAQEFYEGCFKA